MTGNKGEWSEIYVFLKLLAEGKLYAADSKLGRISEVFYPIIAILRKDTSGARNYVRGSKIRIVNPANNSTLIEVEIARFVSAAKFLLKKIRDSANSSFEVRETTEFLRTIDVHSLKAKSSDKRDITIVVHDLRTNMDPVLGFSIKSNLGSASTLLNPGKTTNFVYRVVGRQFTNAEIDEINDISTKSKVRDRLREITEKGRTLCFADTTERNFKLNLQMIDSVMPDIVAQMLFHFYCGQGNNVTDLVDLLVTNNPLGFDQELLHPLYEYKVKSLLTDIALGMTPARLWEGKYDATGGYIIVKADGEVLCYHIYNRNEFQNYLLDNTRFDTPSTSRYDFGYIYSEHGSQFIKLNLQIRFK